MWFDPSALAVAPQSPPATLAIPATLAQAEGSETAKVAEIAEIAAPGSENGAVSRCWVLHFANNRNPLEVAISPAATRAEVLERYPDAAAAEPLMAIPGEPCGPLLGDEEESVRAWLAEIGEGGEATVIDVLHRCRVDDEARDYFLARATEVRTEDDLDDRRFCTQCRNLRAGVCIVAEPGGLVSAIRGYRPSQDILHRCAAYTPP